MKRSDGHWFLGTIVAVAVLLLSAIDPAGAATVNWVGATGFTDVVANWSSFPFFPGPGDDVVIDVPGQQTITHRFGFGFSRSVTSQEAIVITGGFLASTNASLINNTFTLSGGTLGGTATLTITGLTTLTSGSMTETGTTRAQGNVNISGNVGLDSGRVFETRATTTWTGGNVNLNPAFNTGSGRIDNTATGLWDAQGNNTISASGFLDLNTLAGFPAFNNAGTFRKSAGAGTTSIDVPFNNTGTVQVQTGTLNLTGGVTGPTGTLRVSGGGTLTLGAASTTGTLDIAGSTLALGANNVTVSTDYTNVGFGTGNSFNRRANVTGTGQILAAGNVQLGIAVGGGAPVAGNVTMDFGTLHQGDPASTMMYRLHNLGSTGPVLRGAIQTAAGGGNITDARLSGSGVTAGNVGPIGLGASVGNFAVTFTPTSVGALSGQVVHFATNFDNVTGRNLSIMGEVNGIVFRLAQPSAHTPEPVTLGNVRVGAPATQALTISNLALNDGFSEKLNASFGTLTGPVTAAGSISLLPPGAPGNPAATDSTSLVVGINTATAGAKVGTAQLLLASDGTGTSGLGITPLPSQTVNISGNVFRLAQAGAHSPEPVNLGNVHVGASATQALSLTNTAANDGFSEKLNASLSGATAGVTASGSFALLGPGATNNTNLIVGLNTATAGAKSGTATITLQSDGTGTSGFAAIGIGTQTVNVSGNVFRLAQPNAIAAVTFGTVHVGDVVSQPLTISNLAANDGFSERLNAAFGGTSDARITTSGSISLLAPGATNNTSMVVGLNTTNAGVVNGTATVTFQSDGTGTSGLGTTNLPSQNVPVSGDIQMVGQVFRLAQPSQHTPEPVNLGNVRVGAVAQQALTISNFALNDGFSEKLNASFGTLTGPVTAAGSISLLPPGAPGNPAATDSTSLVVGINTATAGAKVGTAQLLLASDGTGTSGLGITPLPSQTVNISGAVFNPAQAQLNTPALTLAARVGDALASTQKAVSLTNTAPAGLFSEGLKVTPGAAPAGFTVNGMIANLAAAVSDAGSLTVRLASTGAAGTIGGTLGLDLFSTGVGTSGLADLALGTANVTLTGKVYTPGVAEVTPTTLDFGIVHKGDVVPARALTVRNTAPASALNDVLQGSLGPATPGPFTSGGTLGAGLGAGATDATSLTASLNTGAAGVFNRSATLSLASHNADMADLALGDHAISLLAQVNNFANPIFLKSGGVGTLQRSGEDFLLDFGTLFLNRGTATALLGVQNDVAAPADLLDGDMDTLLMDPDVQFAGFSFADLAPGDMALGLSIGLETDMLGLFERRLVLHSEGHNASGFRGALDDLTLLVRGRVIEQPSGMPAPSTLGVVLLGGIALGWNVLWRRGRA